MTDEEVPAKSAEPEARPYTEVREKLADLEMIPGGLYASRHYEPKENPTESKD